MTGEWVPLDEISHKDGLCTKNHLAIALVAIRLPGLCVVCMEGGHLHANTC